jgi:hydroxymethylpyrimidine/phosphomethylpyrimidine kinase
MYKAMTIAGSDSGGGAGIQADLKTFSAFGVYGTSVITALTAQNTIGVQNVLPIAADFVQDQISSIMNDIGTDAAKTGMLASKDIVRIVANCIKKFNISNLVVDPVMVAKSGDSLLSPSARQAIIEELLPLAKVVTPNLYEAETMLNISIKSIDDMKKAAGELKKTGCEWIIIKGGHSKDDREALDVVFNGKDYTLIKSKRYKTPNTHGTGCTFSSAIAAGLAKGYSTLEAIKQAKKFTSEAIRTHFPIGKGHGPTNHFVGVKTIW